MGTVLLFHLSYKTNYHGTTQSLAPHNFIFPDIIVSGLHIKLYYKAEEM